MPSRSSAPALVPDEGRLGARPVQRPREPSAEAGVVPLGLGRRRDGVLFVPPAHRAEAAAPLVVMLHGAGGDARATLPFIQQQAAFAGALVVAPDSREGSWDFIVGDLGPDVEFLDRALASVFARFAVDARRVAAAGFSDGASYALTLGIANGDLFTHVLAFSPGFAAPPAHVGQPKLFVSHGEADRVLPIERCSRRLVPRLASAGYDVTYREFDGAHTVPAEVADEAMRWFLSE